MVSRDCLDEKLTLRQGWNLPQAGPPPYKIVRDNEKLALETLGLVEYLFAANKNATSNKTLEQTFN